MQYHLHLQLKTATDYAHSKGLAVKGDIPIGIGRQSCDAWVAPELYNMSRQSGAPPDDFAAEGQNWTFPTSVISSIDNGSETGEITFFIRVNEKGSVTEIRIEKTNVKLSLAEKYKKAIKGARFTPKDEGKREGASGLKTIRIVPTN